ncbi:tRNA pseudouridine(55) synthase TruB [Lactobacillaceae bacterium L1_55_11]|nr:tRNA pseudouridine(55) synthase TruB [Lactobacillaceae bacterium L1_55_11]
MADQDTNGLLVVNKPRGMTSFDVVAQVRRVFNQKKVGHSGTLDPNVDGVLVLALGKATKLIDLLQSRPKEYRGEITLGFTTETEDATGAVVDNHPLDQPLPADTIDAGLGQLNGPIIQVPPMYSAVKVNGRRLYDYARQGEVVERPKRQATIYDFHRTSDPVFKDGYQSFDFVAQVSKGTYIRTLATDFGQHLSLPATMTALTRVAGSGFTLADSTDLATLKTMNLAEAQQLVHPLASVLDWPRHDLTDAEWFAVRNGQKITAWPINDSGYLQLYYQGQLKAVYQYDESGPYWRSRYVFDNQ